MFRLGLFRCGVELEERPIHEFIHFHYGSLVAAAVTIIGRGENCDDVFLVTPIVSIHDQLMSPAHQTQAICLVELFTYILAEGVPGTSRGDTPAHAIVGI
jgi:hypothetical protein